MPADTIEAPAAEAAPETATPAPTIGARFRDAFNKLENQQAEAPQKQPEAKPTEVAPEQKKEAAPAKTEAKPARSAIDAALDTEPATPEPAADEDPLKAFPEDAKQKDWKGLRGAASKAFTELNELRAKLSKTSEADPAIVSELRQTLAQRETALKETEARLAEYNDAMTAVNLELHPDFRREYIDGRKALVNDAMAKFKAYDGNPEQLADALSLPAGKRRDEALEQLVGDLSDTAKTKILKIAADVETLDERKQKALSNSQQAYEELERKTLAQRQKEAAAAEEIKTAEFERITREVQKAIPFLRPVDETVEGGKEWNTAINQAKEGAFKLFAPEAEFSSMVTTAIKGMDYDRVTSMLIAERKESAALRAQLAQFDGAQPDIRTNKTPAATAEQKTAFQKYSEALEKGRGNDDL